jgi:hypothetical protein
VEEFNDTLIAGFFNKDTPPIIGSANGSIAKNNNLDIGWSKVTKAAIKNARIEPIGIVRMTI